MAGDVFIHKIHTDFQRLIPKKESKLTNENFIWIIC